MLLFKVYVRLNHIQQRYILEYFFLEEANKNNGKIILNGIIFDNENYLVESLQLCQHDIETNQVSSVFGTD